MSKHTPREEDQKTDQNSDLYLESFTNIKALTKFILKTPDGKYLIFLSTLFLCWTGWLYLGANHQNRSYWALVFIYPILLLVIYLRHRIGTKASDTTPIPFAIASLTAMALAPIYIIYWK